LNADCEDDEVCENGECISEENSQAGGTECITNWNCVGSQYCENGYCISGDEDEDDDEIDEEECIINLDCEGDKICFDGTCVDKLEEGECNNKYDCKKTEFCIDNVCVSQDLGMDEVQEIEGFDEAEGYDIVVEEDGELVVVKDGEIIKESASLKTCAELTGSVCQGSTICNGTIVYAKDNQCCIGSCQKESPATNTKPLGWAIIGALVLLLIAFLSKFSKSKNRKIDFDKAARGRRR